MKDARMKALAVVAALLVGLFALAGCSSSTTTTVPGGSTGTNRGPGMMGGSNGTNGTGDTSNGY